MSVGWEDSWGTVGLVGRALAQEGAEARTVEITGERGG